MSFDDESFQKYESFYKCVDSLVLLNKSNREYSKRQREHLSPLTYLLEFCTVRLDIGRNVGKTSYIFLRANPEKDLIFSNERQFKSNRHIISPRTGVVHYYNCIPEIIYVDEPHLCFSSDDEFRQYMRYLASSHTEQTLVILGR